MYCSYCGKEIGDESAFCKYCGEKIYTNNRVRSVANQSYSNAAAPQPVQPLMYKKPNNKSVFIIIGGAVIGLISIIILVAVISGLSHNLEGTYRCNDDMLLTSFTFYNDGTVTATNDYCPNDYNYGDVYTGKYKKSFGKYIIVLDKKDGDSTMFDDTYEISAEKSGDDTLEISIHHKLSYFENYSYYHKVY